jgi:hypothetical protein
MSRKDELFKLADLFHSQARLAGSRRVKEGLRKLGDQYQHEAEKPQREVSAESRTESTGRRHSHARAA